MSGPTSGDWDNAANWSSGLPHFSQLEVRIINVGSKAVEVRPATPVDFPSTMTVDNLRVGGVPPGTNTLLMNFFGTTIPLSVLHDFNIDANGRVLMLYSGLNVSNALNLHGAFDQEGGQLTFTNSVTNTMQIEGGRLNLTNGIVSGANMYLGGTNDGFVNQASGIVQLDWLMLGSKPGVPGSTGSGTYVLQSGWLIVEVHEGVGATGFGTLTQSNGTNSASEIFVGNGTYVKNGGGLFAGEVRIIGPSAPVFSPPNAIMTHAGGTATITNALRLEGQGNRLSPRLATFNMFGGSLSTPRILLEVAANFTQTNGTVNVTNELIVSDNGSVTSVYHLFGGNLFTSQTTVSSSFQQSSSFTQEGGTHFATNTLAINGVATYRLVGGTVRASNIVLAGSIFNPPQFFVVGAPSFTVTNQFTTLSGGAIVMQDSSQRFGRLTLSADSGINLAGNSAILRFADSHTNSWQSQLVGVVPRLLVFGWAGSTNGGGTDQLVFGTNSSGLTASQLSQIDFINPAGFPAGTNHARILATGEVVPVSATVLGFQNNGTNLVLSWSGNSILQSATNAVGPYLDLPNATSPYSVNVNQLPMQFFRLRGQ